MPGRQLAEVHRRAGRARRGPAAANEIRRERMLLRPHRPAFPFLRVVERSPAWRIIRATGFSPTWRPRPSLSSLNTRGEPDVCSLSSKIPRICSVSIQSAALGRRAAASLPVVIAGARHAEGPAHARDRLAITLFLDQPVQARRRSVSGRRNTRPASGSHARARAHAPARGSLRSSSRRLSQAVVALATIQLVLGRIQIPSNSAPTPARRRPHAPNGRWP